MHVHVDFIVEEELFEALDQFSRIDAGDEFNHRSDGLRVLIMPRNMIWKRNVRIMSP